MKLYFTRHVESEANTRKEFSNKGFKHPLTDNGMRQARTLAESLQGIHFTHVYTSPILRAIHTTEIVADILHIAAFEVHEDLREYDVGILEGRSDVESWKKYETIEEIWRNQHGHDEKIESGESYTEIQTRFARFIDKIIEDNAEEQANILNITHGGLLKIGLPKIMSNITYEFSRKNVIGHCELIIGTEKKKTITCSQWGNNKLFGEWVTPVDARQA